MVEIYTYLIQSLLEMQFMIIEPSNLVSNSSLYIGIDHVMLYRLMTLEIDL
jgi:hypothetical protein